MADKKGVSYRINLDRTKTTKWAQAQPVDYGGDDWGDEEYDDYEPELPHVSQSLSAPRAEQPQPAGVRNTSIPAQRNPTNSKSIAHERNLSFDREDDRSLFSTGTPVGGELQPSETRSLVSPAERALPPNIVKTRDQPSLQVDTGSPSLLSQTMRPASRSTPTAQAQESPRLTRTDSFAGTSHPGNRSALDEDDLVHADKTSSSTPVHPPRKSSLSSQRSLTALRTGHQSGASPVRLAQESASPPKSPQIIRPADIYKRMEEEREKERKSQESSRPSLESTTGIANSRPTSADEPAQLAMHNTSIQEDVSQTQKASKHGAVLGREPLPTASSSEPQSPEQHLNRPKFSTHLNSAYDNFLDPVSSSNSSGQTSPLPMLPEIPFVSPFPTPGMNQPTPPLSILPRSRFNPSAEQDTSELPQFQRGVAAPTSLLKNVANLSNSTKGTQPVAAISKQDELRHKPSTGFTSTVHKAFDEESRGDLSPSTANETVPRSNSASTADISPIINRKAEEYDYFHMPGRRNETISEEPTTPHGRPGSSTTIKPDHRQREPGSLEPSPAVLGSRRSSETPSPANSPARRPISTDAPHVPEAEHRLFHNDKSTVDPRSNRSQTANEAQDASSGDDEHLNETTEVNIRNISSKRESPNRWQAQRSPFHTHHGSDESSISTPVLSSPISRSEIPAKGTVREIADKLESNSGRSTPVSLTATEPTMSAVHRPAAQSRFESFRPSLPGSWQSDTVTPSLRTVGTQDYLPSQPNFASEHSRTTSTDSIPTATAPTNWLTQEDGPLDKALAAAAAAGTAMAGAFSGTAFSRKTPQYSDSESEEEADATENITQQPSVSLTRDFATSSPRSNLPHVATDVATPSAITPLELPDVEPTSSERHTPVDFPAPLRTNRMNEGTPVSPRVSTFDPSTASPEEDAEQLQKDIFQSLTPKTSNIDHSAVKTAGQQSATGHMRPVNARAESEASYDDVLPQEYNSYWTDKPSGEERATEHLDSTPTRAAAQILPHVSTSADSNVSTPREVHSIPVPITNDRTSTRSVSPLPALIPHEEAHPQRPLLEQRFSWETPEHKHSTLNVRQAMHLNRPVTPPNVAPATAHESSRTPISQPSMLRSNALSASTTDARGLPQAALTAEETRLPETPALPTPTNFFAATTADTVSTISNEAINFKSILGYNDPQRRIRAFDDNKRVYAESDGQLDTWLSSLNVPEHAEVFLTSRQPRVMRAASQYDSQTASRREGPPGSGTKQMQENTRQLIAVAGKYSEKAGFVAKGLFAKGKDKLRTVSASDKVPPKSRRTSTNDTSPAVTPLTEPSTIAATTPRIPSPKLNTYVEQGSWSLNSTTINQIFNDPSYQQDHDSGVGPQSTQLGTRGELANTRDEKHYSSALNDPRLLARAEGVQNSSVYGETTNPSSSRLSSSPMLGRPTDEEVSSTHAPDAIRPSLNTMHGVSTGMQGTDTSSRPRAKEQMKSLLRSQSSIRRGRPSSISDISEVSRSSGPEEPAIVHTRAISPPPGQLTTTKSHEVPLFFSHDLGKEVEARQETEESTLTAGHGSLPPYSGPAARTDHSQIAAGTEIVPVTDLGSVRDNARRTSGRPFSFMGIETLSSVPPYQPDSSSPNVASMVEPEQRPHVGETIKGPTSTNHTAYQHTQVRESNGPNERQNPVPGFRSPSESLDLFRQHSGHRKVTTTPSPERYRIPGPYVQEYRAPKPKVQYEDVHASRSRSITNTGMISNTSIATEVPSQPATPIDFKPISQSSSEQISRIASQTSDSDGRQNQLLHDFFRGRSDSRQRDNRYEPSRAMGRLNDEEKKQRRVSFRLNSSNDMSAPQSDHVSEGRAYRAQANDQDEDRRRPSWEPLGSSPSRSKKSADTKKKRSSGLASLFSRFGNKDRNESATSRLQPSNAHQPVQQSSIRPVRLTASSDIRQGAVHDQAPFDLQSVPGPGRFENQNPVSRYGEKPEYSRMSESSQGDQSRNQHAERLEHLSINTNNNNRPMNEPFTTTTTTTTTPYTTAPVTMYQPSLTQVTSYSTSPPIPITRASRDISYGQDRPYAPTTSSQTQVNPQSNMADHVKDLHKRSRSPRLGRAPSDDHLRTRDESAANTLNIPNPATGLGTFSNKKASPVGAQRSEEDQEKPWTLTLPSDANANDDEDDTYVMVDHEQRSSGNEGEHEGLQNSQTPQTVPERSRSREPDQETIPSENNPTQSQQSREAKRVLMERSSQSIATSEPGRTDLTRPQTVAERFMGIQGSARSTTPTPNPPIQNTKHWGHDDIPPQTIPRTNTANPMPNPHPPPNATHPRSTVLTPISNNTTSAREDIKQPRSTTHSVISPYQDQDLRRISPLPETHTFHTQNSTESFPVELPGSKPIGYESDDEPIMSATAYPGQEWMPLYDGGDGEGRWDD